MSLSWKDSPWSENILIAVAAVNKEGSLAGFYDISTFVGY